MQRKIIGIISDFCKNDTTSLLKTPFYRVRDKYVNMLKRYIKHKNISIVILPYVKESINNYVDLCDGVLLVGGDDIPPDMYGEVSTLREEQILRERYSFEIEFIRKFLKKNKPLLGICAGMQSINVALKGKLYQDIGSNSKINHWQKDNFSSSSHLIRINKNSLLYKITNVSRSKVNSMHHQAIKKIGRNLIPSAFSSDGIIEAIELKRHIFCVGVQWHPEWISSKIDIKLFKYFCNII